MKRQSRPLADFLRGLPADVDTLYAESGMKEGTGWKMDPVGDGFDPSPVEGEDRDEWATRVAAEIDAALRDAAPDAGMLRVFGRTGRRVRGTWSRSDPRKVPPPEDSESMAGAMVRAMDACSRMVETMRETVQGLAGMLVEREGEIDEARREHAEAISLVERLTEAVEAGSGTAVSETAKHAGDEVLSALADALRGKNRKAPEGPPSDEEVWGLWESLDPEQRNRLLRRASSVPPQPPPEKTP